MAGDTAAAAQAAPVFLDREATISRLAEWVAKARDAGADLVVFGESFVPAFPLWNMLYAPVEQLDQPLPKCVYGSGRTSSADLMLTNPITGVPGCCARAASGQAAAPPRSAINSRRLYNGK
jgi:predicted amidohydrolase